MVEKSEESFDHFTVWSTKVALLFATDFRFRFDQKATEVIFEGFQIERF